MNLSREPLFKVSTVPAGVGVLIALFVAFGPDLNQEQTAAIMGAAVFFAPFVVWAVGRYSTTPLDDPRDDAGRSLVPKDPVARAYRG